MKLPAIVQVRISDLAKNPYPLCLETATAGIFEQFAWNQTLAQLELTYKVHVSEPVLKPLQESDTGASLEAVISISDVKTSYLELRYVLFRDRDIHACAEFKARIFCYDTHAQQIDWPPGLKAEFDAAWFEQNWSDDSD